jgi:flavin reductase (DIM6/NTAB) family NADH-FMN oxidoreductase RutF
MPDRAALDVFARLDPPVWLVTAQAAGRRGGLIATFVNQASIAPDCPRVLVGLARQHFTWELVEQSRCFALQLLGEAHLDWVWRFGLSSGRDTDKFAGLETVATPLGTPRLAAALAWLDCRVEAALDTGDRSVYLAAVTDAGQTGATPPLTMQRVLQLAPPERLVELKRQLERDQVRDTAAIRAWRGLVEAE